ncbi:arginine--tRNA ligase [Patescibacteria group bacterium]|nr:arginine--tRNA ligase [Patescibacteria group bacterium]
MLRQRILEDLKNTAKDLGYPSNDIFLSIPQNSSFGNYTSNMALQLAKLESSKGKQSVPPSAKQNGSAIKVANKILEKFGKPDYLEKVEIAGSGFINFFIKDSELVKNANNSDILQKSTKTSKVLIEYGHVNPLKEVHIGHLRTFILGESLCRIYESLGHTVFRANYQGDIGLHIAKAIWGIKKLGLPSQELCLKKKADFLGRAYAKGNKSYEEDSVCKKEIDKINIGLYQKQPELQEIYQLARSWSLEYFEPIYELLGIKYDRCFFESEVFETGKQIVLQNLGKVFKESDGAIIFPGEKHGLHNRVFITSAGNPTYEGKEIGLAEIEYDAFDYDKSIHVVASEQEGYFQVVIKAIEFIFPYLKQKKYHLSYGVVDLSEGKMSSRTGNVVTVDDLYHVVCEKVREVMEKGSLGIDQEVVRVVALGAIKFSYLKFSPRPNMVFDLAQSVSLDGDSGPYVQYAFARIQSVLRNSKKQPEAMIETTVLDKQERTLLRQLLYFSETVEEALKLGHPNLIASYLIELSRSYNLFYQECRILESQKQDFRLKLSLEVSKVLKKGLNLLGIEAPDRM